MGNEPVKNANFLTDVELDPDSLAMANQDVLQERRIAIFDLLEENYFEVEGVESGPYKLYISVSEQKLVFDIRDANDEPVKIHILSLSPLRRIIRDYLMICDSYHHAIRNSTPSQIEAIDMGRRGLHNEGTELLELRLKGKINLNFDTARRLFTLVCALHIRL
jgi:uncharacterized protein (UPF0262 family)